MSTTEATVRLGEALRGAGLGGYLAHTPSTVAALVGLNEGPGERFSALVLNPAGEYVLICPALSVNQARRSGVGAMRPLLDGVDPGPVVREVFSELGISGCVGFDDLMPAIHVVRLQEVFPDLSFEAAGRVFGSLSRTKGEVEAALLLEAGRIADETFAEVKGLIRAGMTEAEVDGLLRAGMARRGGVPAFSIVAAGPNGAECHHHTDETVLKAGDAVILDFGCDVGGFKSDTTRTVSIGEPSAKVREIYEVVLRSHWAAREAIRPGCRAGDIDKAARDVISAAGYGEWFVHRVGHGLGREVHEEPYILPESQEELKPGDVFSIEPGIYLPDEFGVRIENIVMMTEDGHRSFNVDPPAEITVVG